MKLTKSEEAGRRFDTGAEPLGGAGRQHRERGAHHGHEIAGSALVGMTRIPAGEGGDRHPQLRRPDAGAA